MEALSTSSTGLIFLVGLGVLLWYLQKRGLPVWSTLLNVVHFFVGCIGSLLKREATTRQSRSTSADDDVEIGKLLGSPSRANRPDADDKKSFNPSFVGTPPGYQPLLSPADARTLASHLPSRVQGRDLSLLFSTRLHGYALRTLWSKVRHHGPTLTVVMDDSGAVFGGFASRDWSGTDAGAAVITGGARAGHGTNTSTTPTRPGPAGPGGALDGQQAQAAHHWARGTVGYFGSPGALGKGEGRTLAAARVSCSRQGEGHPLVQVRVLLELGLPRSGLLQLPLPQPAQGSPA